MIPFKDGMYKHKSGFTLMVTKGKAYINGRWPLSLRLSELIDEEAWEVMEDVSKDEG